MAKIYTYRYCSPWGDIVMVWQGSGLVNMSLPDRAEGIPEGWLNRWWPGFEIKVDANPFTELTIQLNNYFTGKLTKFDVPLILKGTEFQKKVWDALRAIPYGETRSYAEVASMIGSSKACRAVGGANNKNPIPIIVPCHRVIGKSGGMVGFGGGIDMKKRLLALESGVVDNKKE